MFSAVQLSSSSSRQFPPRFEKRGVLLEKIKRGAKHFRELGASGDELDHGRDDEMDETLHSFRLPTLTAKHFLQELGPGLREWLALDDHRVIVEAPRMEVTCPSTFRGELSRLNEAIICSKMRDRMRFGDYCSFGRDGFFRDGLERFACFSPFPDYPVFPMIRK
jgi:hypothetical protein